MVSTFSYSRRNILFLVPISKLAMTFALMPMYNFHTDIFSYNNVFKCYSIFLTGIFSVSTILNIVGRNIEKPSEGFLVVLDVLLNTSGILTFAVTSLSAAFWHRKTWGELVKKMKILESRTHLNSVSLKEKYCIRNANLPVCFATVLYISACIAIFISGANYMFVLSLIMYFGEFVLATIVSNIALSIKYKFEDINYTLFKTGSNVGSTVKLVEKLYFDTRDLVDIFNKLFGWPILGMIVHALMQILATLINTAIETHGDPSAFLGSVVLSFFDSLGPLVIILSCDKAVKASRTLLATCYKLEGKFQLYSEEIQGLEVQVIKHCPVFTAADFFKLNRSTLLHLLSTITTYFIVGIQLYNHKIL